MTIKNVELNYRISGRYTYYQVIGDTERFGKHEILFESPFFDEVKGFINANDCKRKKTKVKFETNFAEIDEVKRLNKKYCTDAYGNTDDEEYRLLAYIYCGSESEMYTLVRVLSHAKETGFSTDIDCSADEADENGKWVFWAVADDVKGHVNELKRGLREFII